MELNPEITYFAQTDFRGKKTPFGIRSLDRSRHVYIIGKTGMGKSTMLENMAIQDIQNGHGIGFVDPHGKSADLMLEYVPEERIKDVVYFAPHDMDNPIAFNIMEDVGKDQRHLVANGLMSTFKKIWPDVWSSRMEYILGNCILALLEYPESTLLGVNRMLSDKAYRQKVVDNISDPSVKSFWVDEFAKYNERYMQEAGDAIKNKIGQFTGNPLIRNIIGQPKSSFDLRQLMDEKKILIINLSKGRIGEQNANLLGGMLITKIYLAAMSRANLNDLEVKKLPAFNLFVDEFQSFVNDSFADILAEARKYKLNLTIAHQYVEQMPELVRSAVFGNVGTTVAFRVGPFDAELLEKVFSPKFMQEDLVNLGFAQIYLTMSIDGVGSPPFSAVTLPPIPVLKDSNREKIIANSRDVYARPRDLVEKQIVDWHDSGHDEPKGARSAGGDSRSSFNRPGGDFRTKAPVRREEAPRPASNFHEEAPRPVAEKISLSKLEDKNKKEVGTSYKDDLRSLLNAVQEEKENEVKAPIHNPTPIPTEPKLVESKNKIDWSGEKKIPLSALSTGKKTADREELHNALADLIAEGDEVKKVEPEKKPEVKREIKIEEPVAPVPSKAQDPLGPDEETLRRMLRVDLDEKQQNN